MTAAFLYSRQFRAYYPNEVIGMLEYVSCDLEENIREIKKIFGADGTLICRRIQPLRFKTPRCCLFCIDGMASAQLLNESVARPITLLELQPAKETATVDFLQQQVLQACESKQERIVKELLHALLYGDAILFIDGSDQALILGSKGFLKRGITEPVSETCLKGPREGFVEPLLHNLAMIRRRLRTTDLKLEYFTLGSVTKTDCCLCYLESCVDPDVLACLRKRLEQITIDGVIDSNYIAELIRDRPYSLFRTTGSSERPDVVAAKLLEGRIAILSDGSPMAVTVPYIFLEQFQSSEDYYVDVGFAGINRVLRVLGFFFAVSVLPVYLSLVVFHHAFMPLKLILSIAAARQDVPFPIFVEALILLCSFDILREAGVRTPSNMGQTLSVVGGLVIGQAAVEARLVSVPVLIIVAVSGICALIAPKLKAVTLVCRLFFMCLGVNFGLYGYLLGVLMVAALLSGLTSFGVPYLAGLPLFDTEKSEDSLIRPPFWRMKRFGRFLSGKGR